MRRWCQLIKLIPSIVLVFLFAIPAEGLLRAISGADNLKSWFPFRKELDNTFGSCIDSADRTADNSDGDGHTDSKIGLEGLPEIYEDQLKSDSSESIYFTVTDEDLFREEEFTVWVRCMSEDESDVSYIFAAGTHEEYYDDNQFLLLDFGPSKKLRAQWDHSASGSNTYRAYCQTGTILSPAGSYDSVYMWIQLSKNGSGTSGKWLRLSAYSDDSGRVGTLLGYKQTSSGNRTAWPDPFEQSIHFGNAGGGNPSWIDEVYIYDDEPHNEYPRP